VFSRFFIDRPIFASVLSIVITLAGGIAVVNLPLAQYPPVTPPTIQVDCNYPGASAQVVAETVAAPIEQQVNGVEDMLYMASQCTNDGSYTLTVTFKVGVNLNLAQVLVQNRINLALPQLPDVVKQTGVTTKKRSPDILLVIYVNSPDGRYDQLYLSNYALMHIRDEVARVPGVGDVFVFGQRDYSMRVWVDPEKLAVRGLSASDVVAALRDQNAQVAVGSVGQPPAVDGQAVQITLSTLGRLETPEQFADVVINRPKPGEPVIRIRDVGWVTLGAKSEDITNRYNQTPNVGLAIFQLPDANALDTGDRVKAKMEELKREFPDGVTYDVGYDTTPFIKESVDEVFKALRDSIILVALVVLVFLGGWRPALVPLAAVPVAVVGTFAAMAACGFSLNNLTLFGLVLAIGIVVDDAIVVVEAVEHHVERGLSPRDAAYRAMAEVSGPVIAVGLVLSAVFVPCAFLSGIVGQFFRQFALTIAISTLISAFNSLTLSPALCAILLKPRPAGRRQSALPRPAFALAGGWAGLRIFGPWLAAKLAVWFPHAPWAQLGPVVPWAAAVLGVAVGWLAGKPLDWLLAWAFHLFNKAFALGTGVYARIVGMSFRIAAVVLLLYGGLLGLTYWGYLQLPTGFIPTQDKGYLLASIQLPDAASVERTKAVIAKIETICLSTPGVKNTSSVAGNSFMLSAYGSNFGSMFIMLKPFDERRESPELAGEAIIGRLRKRFAKEVPEATINVFPPPAVSGLGRVGGFKCMVESRGENSLETLEKVTNALVENGNQQRGLVGLFTVFKAGSPQLYVDVDRRKCLSQGVELAEVFGALQVYLGSRYVNDFNRFGRTWQVVVQADSRFRTEKDAYKKLQVRNAKGGMVPLAALVDVRESSGPLVLTRYNMYPAAAINGSGAAGVSSGDARSLMEQLAAQELPASMAFEWTEITYIEQISGNTGMIVFAVSVLFVFLVLAALYESWSLPLAVILVVPMCVLGSVAAVWLRGQDINLFTQVGLVVLVGLACKNAILIVEFAKLRREAGVSRREAALEACRLRLRPIVMTSFAFILGVVPLVVARGAGAEMRQALGTAVFGGMIGVTLFGIFLTPVFFVVVDWVGGWHVFHSPRVRRFAALLREVLTLRILARPVRTGWRAARAAAPRLVRPSGLFSRK
jgi:multidrug efflux pump